MWKEFQAHDIDVVFANSDSLEDARALAEKFGLTMPLAYGLHPEDTSRALGCFYDSKDKYIQSAGFLINPEGRLYVSSYSSGPVGRIRAENAFSIIRYFQTEDVSMLP